jgi:hypothetical protein
VASPRSRSRRSAARSPCATTWSNRTPPIDPPASRSRRSSAELDSRSSRRTRRRNTYKTCSSGRTTTTLDSLFATFAHRRMYHGTPEGDQAEITIWVTTVPTRIEGPPPRVGRIDEDPTRRTILPLRGRREFDLDFLDSADGDWSEELGLTGTSSTSFPRRADPPRAVRADPRTRTRRSITPT